MKKIHSFYTLQKQPGKRPGKQAMDEPSVYEFRIAQPLSDQWADWFDSLDFARDEQGNTLLRGTLADQAALHGVLIKIRDLNLILLSVVRK